MRAFLAAVTASLLLATVSTAELAAQDAQWRPSTSRMPAMPTSAQLESSWAESLGGWFSGVDAVTGTEFRGLRATGSARGGAARPQVARFMRGPVPVIVMTDRNGDEVADMIEIYRAGRVVIQVIDADYSGSANVMRIYDAAGALLREERL